MSVILGRFQCLLQNVTTDSIPTFSIFLRPDAHHTRSRKKWRRRGKYRWLWFFVSRARCPPYSDERRPFQPIRKRNGASCEVTIGVMPVVCFVVVSGIYRWAERKQVALWCEVTSFYWCLSISTEHIYVASLLGRRSTFFATDFCCTLGVSLPLGLKTKSHSLRVGRGKMADMKFNRIFDLRLSRAVLEVSSMGVTWRNNVCWLVLIICTQWQLMLMGICLDSV